MKCPPALIDAGRRRTLPASRASILSFASWTSDAAIYAPVTDTKRSGLHQTAVPDWLSIRVEGTSRVIKPFTGPAYTPLSSAHLSEPQNGR
ncbi:hypothetical protein CC80DRAFT_490714 [Byssothecium circinans]|uniref:Uncharacterized protein n=1 Tax=Byssothecium circinans TaxID=147558 RepID=A0A6A5U7T1_9PLEO|nr:hypothetical protein CC80DRAFT_490714 [Byssothecium circinans]